MKTFFTLLLLASSVAVAEMESPPQIPQQAYSACIGKTQGESVSDGRMAGTCEYAPDGQLALRPSGPPPNGEQGGGPPDGRRLQENAGAADPNSAQ